MTLTTWFSFAWPGIGAMWGAIFGSFLTVVTTRGAVAVSEGASVREVWASLKGLSHCPKCDRRIAWQHLLPVVSYLALGGRCAHCRTPIPVRYFALEVTAMILGALLFHTYGASWAGVQAMVLMIALIAVAEIDARTTLIPDAITLPCLAVGFLFRLLTPDTDVLSAALHATFDAALGYGVPMGFARAYGAMRRIEMPMGEGDAKLLALICIWFGFWAFMPVAFVGCLSFAVVGAARGLKLREPAPLGPFLCLPALALLYPPVQVAMTPIAHAFGLHDLTPRALLTTSWFHQWLALFQ